GSTARGPPRCYDRVDPLLRAGAHRHPVYDGGARRIAARNSESRRRLIGDCEYLTLIAGHERHVVRVRLRDAEADCGRAGGKSRLSRISIVEVRDIQAVDVYRETEGCGGRGADYRQGAQR